MRPYEPPDYSPYADWPPPPPRPPRARLLSPRWRFIVGAAGWLIIASAIAMWRGWI